MADNKANGNNGNDGGDNDNGEERKLSPTEAAIIEMMKKQAIGSGVTGVAGGDGETKHAFWDTQVRDARSSLFFL